MFTFLSFSNAHALEDVNDTMLNRSSAVNGFVAGGLANACWEYESPNSSTRKDLHFRHFGLVTGLVGGVSLEAWGLRECERKNQQCNIVGIVTLILGAVGYCTGALFDGIYLSGSSSSLLKNTYIAPVLEVGETNSVGVVASKRF